MIAESTTTAAEPRAPYGLRKAIEAIKEAVPVETVANDFGAGLKPSGEDLRGKGVCHGGSNESALLVEPDRGRWHCFRCNEGGDVIDLCRAVEGGELWEAVFSLAQRYGVEMPSRPERWHERRAEKARVREAAKRHIAGVYQRRLTRVYSPLVLLGGQTPQEELRELEELAAALWPISLSMAARRVAGEE